MAQLQAQEGERGGEGTEEEEMEDVLTPDEKRTAEDVKRTIQKSVFFVTFSMLMCVSMHGFLSVQAGGRRTTAG